MKKLLTTFVFAGITWAADVSGTWSGPMEMKRGGETRQDSAHLVLTQTGNEIKGSLGPTADKQLPITKGTITGSDLMLEATIPNKDAKMVLRLKVDGEKLTGELRTEGAEAEDMSGTLSLSRGK